MKDISMMKPLAVALVLAALAVPRISLAQAQKTFATPELAASALADAVRAGDAKALLAIVGPKSKSWIFTGDAVADRADWKTFIMAYDKKNAIARDGDARAILSLGDGEWPFPAPLVKKNGQWAFDAEAGREEVTNRRVGSNELGAIQTLLAIVDAQRTYAASDPDGNGMADYAAKFISSPDKKDGLYWEAKDGKDDSPLGPLVGAASAQGYSTKNASPAKPQPYYGYRYRIVTAQGKGARGGAYDYRVNGRLFGGFAVVAWPASYGVSGVKTFIVNHDGVVYEKDLGSGTSSQASAMSRYNPDKSWQKAQ